jgi:hypothetical protein
VLAGVVLAVAFVSAPAIHVSSCQTFSGILLPSRNEIGLAVRFENTSAQVYRSIVWRAKYGGGYVDFTDDGTFAANVRVDNFILSESSKARFNIGNAFLDLAGPVDAGPSPWVTQNQYVDYASSDEPENCEIVSTVDIDGTTWINPGTPLPHTRIPRAASFGLPGTSATPSPAAAGGVSVADCRYGWYKLGWLRMRLVFRNIGVRPMHRVVFRAAYRRSGIDFADEGVFLPGSTIQHTLKAQLPNAAPASFSETFDDPSSCAVVNVEYADETRWQNPDFAPDPGPFATPVPDALDILTERSNVWNRAQRHDLPTAIPLPATPSASATSF